MRSSAAHIPGITGLRGVAVVAVIAYHLGYLRGGFLGVDVFFVLSGFLITSLLLGTTPGSARDLARWWGRRFRRLTPAVAVVVVVVLLAFRTTGGIVTDATATLTWWQNWHLILVGKPYWATSPSPLRHAWSLSIEEQFYAFWPLTLIVFLRIGRRFRRSRPELAVAGIALLGAALSFGWGIWRAISQTGSLSRIYFGTDTRIGTLLLGCAMAALVHHRPVRLPVRLVNVATVPAVAGLGFLMLASTPELRWTYTVGLLLAALLSMVLVICSTVESPFASLLSLAPLQWLGTHSYALYLWSWPTQVFLQDRFPDMALPAVAVITIAVSMILSDLSLRWVEEPLRRTNSWARKLRPRQAAYFCGAGLIVAAMVLAANSTRPSEIETVAKQFEQLPDPTTTTSTTCPATPTTTVAGLGTRTDEFDPETVTEGTDPTVPVCGADKVIRVLVVGDSLGRGAANGLRRLDDPRLEVWDRTHLGCGMEPPSDKCPDRRQVWAQAVSQIDPDVVLVYLRTIDDILPGDDPPFMSPDAESARRNEMVDATNLLSAGGARIIWALPAVPLDRGAFYCDGRHTDSPCDPTWVARWREDITAAASMTGATTVDVQAWIDQRPRVGAQTDRPDGLHLSGPALVDHAGWLDDQIKNLVAANR